MVEVVVVVMMMVVVAGRGPPPAQRLHARLHTHLSNLKGASGTAHSINRPTDRHNPIQHPRPHTRPRNPANSKTHLHDLQRVVREGEARKRPVVRGRRPEARPPLPGAAAQVRGVGLFL